MRFRDLFTEHSPPGADDRKRTRVQDATRRKSDALHSYETKMRNLSTTTTAAHKITDPSSRKQKLDKLGADQAAARARYERTRQQANDAIRQAMTKKS